MLLSPSPFWLRILACLLALAAAAPADRAHAQKREKTVLMGGDDPVPEEQPAPRKQRQIITARDEKQAGEQASKAVAAQIGLLDSEELKLYVQVIGDRLLKGLPRRSFKYEFSVVDQDEPNAFALPGGFIFISRGLLALAKSEDELGNVIGHEIAHVALRHSVRQQAIQQNMSALSMGYVRHARLSSYGRDMEREADEMGQKLAAAAGYDPRAMSTFMEALGDWEQIITGRKRGASWYDTHPTSSERAAVNGMRASELRWTRDESLGDTHTAHLRRIEGIPVGQRPKNGVFEGDRFLHPDLDFQLRFPKGWRTSNTNAAVGAQARDGSVVFLTADVPPGPPQEAAEKFLAKEKDLRPLKKRPDKIRGKDVWRVEAEAGRAVVQLLFLEHGGNTWLLVGVAPGFRGEQKVIESSLRSFRSLSPDQRNSIRESHLHIVEAQSGEDLPRVSERTQNAWDQGRTAVANGVPWTHQYSGGELVKVAKSAPYVPVKPSGGP